MSALPGAEQQRRRLAGWAKSALLMIGSALLLWTAWICPATADTKRVVLLFDERPGLPGMAAVEAGFVNTLTSHLSDRLEVYREGMDLSRFGPRGPPHPPTSSSATCSIAASPLAPGGRSVKPHRLAHFLEPNSSDDGLPAGPNQRCS